MPRYKRNADKVIHPIKAVASRALFPSQGREVEMVSVQFIDAHGTIHQFDLDVKVARELIESATASYHAIVPVLRTSRGGWGG
jgi:hypothetical protein